MSRLQIRHWLSLPAGGRLVLAVVFGYVVATLVWVVCRDTGHGWKTADWLINYQGGFVRRGLIGQTIFSLGRFGNPVYIATALQTGLFAAVVWQASRLPGARDRLGWMILLSPLLMLFYLYDHSGSMRKEMLGFLFLLLFVRWAPLRRGQGADAGAVLPGRGLLARDQPVRAALPGLAAVAAA